MPSFSAPGWQELLPVDDPKLVQPCGIGPFPPEAGALTLGQAQPGPETGLSLAITVSKLSGGRTATKKILELLLAEVGLAAPVGL